MSLNIAPPSSNPESVAAAVRPSTLQDGPVLIASATNGRHPLESRIATWDANAEEVKLEQYRRVFGAGEPIRRRMELGIVAATDFNPMGGSGLHADILRGKDAEVSFEDVYRGSRVVDVHSEIELRLW